MTANRRPFPKSEMFPISFVPPSRLLWHPRSIVPESSRKLGLEISMSLGNLTTQHWPRLPLSAHVSAKSSSTLGCCSADGMEGGKGSLRHTSNHEGLAILWTGTQP